jgi:hypothetical protein
LTTKRLARIRKFTCEVCAQQFITGRKTQVVCAQLSCKQERMRRNTAAWLAREGNKDRRRKYMRRYYRENLSKEATS